MSLDSLILNYWEFCIAKTVKTFKQHGIEPGNLMYLFMGMIHEAAAPGSLKEKDNAMMQMALKSRITDDSPQ